MKVTQSCPTLCDPMDYTVHGILQARILEWLAFPFSRGSSQPRDQTQVSCIAGRFFTSWPQGKPRIVNRVWKSICNKNESWVWQAWEPIALKKKKRKRKSLLWIKNGLPSGNTRESFPFWNLLDLEAAQPGWAGAAGIKARKNSFSSPSVVKRHGHFISFSKLKARLRRPRGHVTHDKLSLGFLICVMKVKIAPPILTYYVD